MTISAKVIADSISPDNIRLTTLQLRYPKFIHGEAKTHRQLRANNEWFEVLEEVGFMNDPNLSRNASSSRAIPVERLIRDVIDDPVYPSFWGKNQAGMQAAEECTAEIVVRELDDRSTPWEWVETGVSRERAWDLARDNAVKLARAFAKAGYHKQIVNRILEPYCHINVVCTATEWSNFFALRCHRDAQPEMRILAENMKDAMSSSTPIPMATEVDGMPGHWHLPYVTDEDRSIIRPRSVDATHLFNTLIRLSVARCARVSYLTHEGKKPDIAEDLGLYDRLASAVPLHVSPAEHQATPDHLIGTRPSQIWKHPELHGNFRGWIQYRKTLPNECQ